jgi:hypothetical protein
MNSVKVDRLEIHLKGVSPEVARSTVAGLGNEVIGQLSEQPGPSRGKPPKTMARIDLGALEAARGASSSDLRRALASRIVKAITTAG